MRAYVDAISDLSDAVADYNTLLAELQQAQGMSVYEWRQQTVAPTGIHAGHASPGSLDYRSSPDSVARQLVPPAESHIPGDFYSGSRQAPPSTGHSFLTNPKLGNGHAD